MFHHEFIVNNYTVWVRRDVSKLEAFASICPVFADQFMMSAFVMETLQGCYEDNIATQLTSSTYRELPLWTARS